MFEVLHDAIRQLRRLLAEFEPDRFDGAGARSLVEAFGELERLSAAGKSLASIQQALGHVAEGVFAARAVHRLAAELGVEMPIGEAVYSVLYEGVAPRAAVSALLRREPTRE